jgi:hypothetical protein
VVLTPRGLHLQHRTGCGAPAIYTATMRDLLEDGVRILAGSKIGMMFLVGLTGAACYVRPSLPVPDMPQINVAIPVGSGTAAAAIPVGSGAAPPPAARYAGPIEAGCSFDARQIKGQTGEVFQVSCPEGCVNRGSWIRGTDVYTADSGICRAGVHAGAIPPTGGMVTVRLEPGRPAYRGSTRHLIESTDCGTYELSFAVIVPAGQQVAPSPSRDADQIIEAGCSFTARDIHAEVGTTHVVSCPEGCADQGSWLRGTDVYTGDSGICRAAIHSGLIPKTGGTVAVILDRGHPAYRGSVRNGIHSSDVGSFDSSFRLRRP